MGKLQNYGVMKVVEASYRDTGLTDAKFAAWVEEVHPDLKPVTRSQITAARMLLKIKGNHERSNGPPADLLRLVIEELKDKAHSMICSDEQSVEGTPPWQYAEELEKYL